MYAYSYAVQPDKDKQEFISGWTQARDDEDCIEKLLMRFGGVPRERIKVFTYKETWKSFIDGESGRQSGWD